MQVGEQACKQARKKSKCVQAEEGPKIALDPTALERGTSLARLRWRMDRNMAGAYPALAVRRRKIAAPTMESQDRTYTWTLDAS